MTNKEKITEQAKIMLAYANGAKIQCELGKNINTGETIWHDIDNPDWNWKTSNYRIKHKYTPEQQTYIEKIEHAYYNGLKIEYSLNCDKIYWWDVVYPQWQWDKYTYRIKDSKPHTEETFNEWACNNNIKTIKLNGIDNATYVKYKEWPELYQIYYIPPHSDNYVTLKDCHTDTTLTHCSYVNLTIITKEEAYKIIYQTKVEDAWRCGKPLECKGKNNTNWCDYIGLTYGETKKPKTLNWHFYNYRIKEPSPKSKYTYEDQAIMEAFKNGAYILVDGFKLLEWLDGKPFWKIK